MTPERSRSIPGHHRHLGRSRRGISAACVAVERPHFAAYAEEGQVGRWRSQQPFRRPHEFGYLPFKRSDRSSQRAGRLPGELLELFAERARLPDCFVQAIHHGSEARLQAELLLEAREWRRSEEHTSELQSPCNLVCRLL